VTRQLAEVGLRADSLEIVSWSKTEAGFWIPNDFVHVLASGCDDATLGTVVLEALDKSAEGVQTPPPNDLRFSQLLNALGVRSRSEYYRRLKLVEVARGDSIVLTPMDNRGIREGFVPLESTRARELELLSESEPARLGASIRETLAEATCR
jgi:hypothetical protein